MTVATLAAPAASAAPPQRLLCNGLIAIAGFEALAALSSLPGIVAPYLDEVPTRFLLFAQILLSVRYALAPVLAVPALIFALKGRLRAAILALASLLLSAWLLDDTTSFVIHGPELSLSFGGAVVFARHFLFPLCGLAGGRPRLRRPAACACRAIGQPAHAVHLGDLRHLRRRHVQQRLLSSERGVRLARYPRMVSRQRVEEEQHFWNGIALFVFAALCALSVWLIARYGDFDPARIGFLDLALLGLAAFRLVHLLTYDKIFDMVRAAFMDREGTRLKTAERGWRRLMCEFMQCIWCTGMWSGLIVVTIYFLGLWGRFAAIVLAAAGLGSLLQLVSKALAAQT